MKLINQKSMMVSEMVESYLELYPEYYKNIQIDKGNYYAIARQTTPNPVSVVVGSGSGNEPWCIGYVGPGLADGAVIGPSFTAPSSRSVLTLTRNIPHSHGVVYICTNHAGDVLNFELASELAGLEGIVTNTITVTDDLASAPKEEKSERRGTAGVLLVVKIAGGAASMGMNIEDVTRIASKANDNTYTCSAYTSSTYEPETGRILLELPEGMVDYGGGFAGEKGIIRKPFVSADDTADQVFRYLLNEIQPFPSAEVVVLLNAFGKTSDIEMAIIGKRVKYILRKNEIKVHHILIQRSFSLMESSGFSVSIMIVDEELKRCYDQPAWSPNISGFLSHSEKSFPHL